MSTEILSTPEEAIQAGRDAGWSDANYSTAYGSTGAPVSIDVPGRYAEHAIEYTLGFHEGADLFYADRYPDGSHIHPYANE